jgi:hypothetical protein
LEEKDMKLKSWIYIGVAVLILGMISVISLQSSRIDGLKEDLSISIANEKALFADNDSLSNRGRVLQLTVEQLNYINDSIIIKMNEVRKELKIKNKNIKELEYQLSEAKKTDTLIFRDTLFRNPEVKIDTTLRDKWYSLNLKLEYPSTVIASPKFISERYVVQSLRKETIKPPKKCWLGRLFQKKHKIIETVVIEKSPYIINKQEKYIKIIE